ncbi:SPFH domain/Band 7 family protein [Luteimicrobium subarcticum]|uniref:SPFH domain/Band 7 family protein n=2 Tax=Luteimicrobium subarcticum TaxID=620910 RepID=A0A2M8WRP6_9MICO|nr:SPFH domain/Band 7 family protein [Luteimicrobium subarcticum]
MATIKTYPAARRFLGTPTDYVVHLRRGEVAHQGVGQAFWFRPATAVLSEVPATDQELPVLFHAITADHQDVTVQVNVTYRFDDPVKVSQRLDFGIFPARQNAGGAQGAGAVGTGRQQVATIIGQLAQSRAVDHVATLTLTDALELGVGQVRAVLTDALRGDARLQSTGIAVLGVHVLAIRPEADVEKALQTPVRERVQAEADRATYERRALAVERERAISENELASRIELATRREQLVAQEGVNARREAEEAAAAALVEARAAAERRDIGAASKAQEVRLLGEAEAAKDAAAMAVYAGMDRGTLLALAVRDAAGALPKIDNLTITPDMLTGALAAFTQATTGGAR